jgi:membrane protein implicated in regulation of membrane protease activity
VSLLFWHWWIVAGLCLLAEALTPGFVFLWLGISAGATGLLLAVAPDLGWRWQVLAFTALSLASVALWLAWRRRQAPAKATGLNTGRAEACVGQIGVLETPLDSGRHGRLRLGDTTWTATGPDLPSGTRVKIMAARGSVLEVAAEDAVSSVGRSRTSGRDARSPTSG